MSKKITIKMVFVLIIIFCMPFWLQSNEIVISFDYFLPKSLYQKGLESSLRSWQTLVQFFITENKLFFDSLLGQLAFVQFCITSLPKENNVLIDEQDFIYFKKVLQKIQNLLSMIPVN